MAGTAERIELDLAWSILLVGNESLELLRSSELVWLWFIFELLGARIRDYESNINGQILGFDSLVFRSLDEIFIILMIKCIV